MNPSPELKTNGVKREPGVIEVLVHSFFVIPFIIVVFALLFFFMWRILANESDSAYDYLTEIRIGSATKRWQSAFELARILNNPELVPQEERFNSELISTYQNAVYDDPQVRTYLALAMGATRNEQFGEALIVGIIDENIQSKLGAVKALGQIGYNPAVPNLREFLDKSKSDDLRLAATISLGMIGDTLITPDLLLMLDDDEPNIRWESAIALAKMGNLKAIPVIINLLQREYLDRFPNVDNWEKIQALLVAIHTTSILKSNDFIPYLLELAKNDINMKVRDSAIKTLNKTYNREIS